MVWLFCPFTDGATLLYHTITKPYIVPRILPLVKRCEGFLTTLILSIINCRQSVTLDSCGFVLQ